MSSKWMAALSALALAATAVAPAPALAYDHGRHGYSHSYRHHDHGGDAVAIGAVGLILGLAVGAALSDPGPPRGRCYDNYQRCAPPSGPQGYDPGPQGYDYAPPPPPPSDYYDKSSANDQGDEPDDRRADYDRDYGAAPQQQADATPCLHAAQQWDPYAGRYVWVNVRSC